MTLKNILWFLAKLTLTLSLLSCGNQSPGEDAEAIEHKSSLEARDEERAQTTRTGLRHSTGEEHAIVSAAQSGVQTSLADCSRSQYALDSKGASLGEARELELKTKRGEGQMPQDKDTDSNKDCLAER